MKTITVTVVPRSKKNAIVAGPTPESVKAYVTAPASNNKANKALVELLSAYYGAGTTNIRIIRGAHSRKKIVAIA